MAATDSPLPPNAPSIPSAISRAVIAETERLAADPDATNEENVEDPVTPTTGTDGKLKVVEAALSDNGSTKDEEEEGTNLWLGLIASAIDHPDLHVVKVSPPFNFLLFLPFVPSIDEVLTGMNDRSFERSHLQRVISVIPRKGFTAVRYPVPVRWTGRSSFEVSPSLSTPVVEKEWTDKKRNSCWIDDERHGMGTRRTARCLVVSYRSRIRLDLVLRAESSELRPASTSALEHVVLEREIHHHHPFSFSSAGIIDLDELAQEWWNGGDFVEFGLGSGTR